MTAATLSRSSGFGASAFASVRARLAVARRRYRRALAGRSLLVLVVGLWVTSLWQVSLASPEVLHDATYGNYASTGLHAEPLFFFFLYRLGLYPLMPDPGVQIREDTREEAERLLRDEPRRLRYDFDVTFRSGDRGRIYLYYVYAWLTGSSRGPSVHPAVVAAFTLALCALFAMCWWVRRPWLGALLVLVNGSNPFQLNELSQNNVRSWTITSVLLLLALCVPLMQDRWSRRYAWLAAIGLGVLLATIRTVRSEPSIAALGVVMVFLTLRRAEWWRRAALVVLFGATLSAMGVAYVKFFDHKFKQAENAVVRAGGEAYGGPITTYHEVWHPIFSGLGDFDQKYGYEWEDTVGYHYAYPILKQRLGDAVRYLDPNRAAQMATWDRGMRYPRYFSETPGYHEIIRDKVLSDIRKDPAWYLDILRRRAGRILEDHTPFSIATPRGQPMAPQFPMGRAVLVLLALLLVTRRRFEAKLIVFSMVTSLVALLVYSDRGQVYYGLFHYFAAVVAVSLIGNWLRRAFCRVALVT